MKLDVVIHAAREREVEWGGDRARRVLAGALARRERAAARARFARRSLVGVAASAAVVFVLLRGSSAPAGASVAATRADLSEPPTVLSSTSDVFAAAPQVSGAGGANAYASAFASDAGYARD